MAFVLVTGASQGIGAAIALRFAQERNVRLAVVARNTGALKQVADDCRQLGADARFFQCDLTKEREVAQFAENLEADMGTPGVIVNNAGSFQPGSVESTSPTDFRHQIESNLLSAFYVTHAFLPTMVRRKSGHIFFLASVASIKGYPAGAAYCAAKHGLLGLARALREETREVGIRVTSVMPGATYTKSWAGTGLPENRFIPPEDVARTIVDAYHLSSRSVIEEILLRPQLGDL